MNALAATKTVAARALQWKVSPAPRSLAESRQILRVLQTLGEVVTYKWLKYDKPNFEDDGGLVIFRDENAAAHVLSRSPIRFTLKRLKEPSAKDSVLHFGDEKTVNDFPEGAPSSPLLRSWRYTEFRRGQREAQDLEEQKEKDEAFREGPVLVDQEFELRAERWEGSHRAYNERTKFFNPFNPDHYSPIREDLAKRVPLRSLSNVVMEPPGGEIPLDKLRKYAAEVEQRPKLRDWVRERESANVAKEESRMLQSGIKLH